MPSVWYSLRSRQGTRRARMIAHDASASMQGRLAPARGALGGSRPHQCLPEFVSSLVDFQKIVLQLGLRRLGIAAGSHHPGYPLRQSDECLPVGFTWFPRLLGLRDLGLKGAEGFDQLRACIRCWGDVSRIADVVRLKGPAVPGVDLAQTLVELLGAQLLRAAQAQIGELGAKHLGVNPVLVNAAPELFQLWRCHLLKRCRWGGIG